MTGSNLIRQLQTSVLPAETPPSRVVGNRESHPPAHCPVNTDHLLAQSTFYGIQVDTCAIHNGIWFDGGELAYLAAQWRPLMLRMRPPGAAQLGRAIIGCSSAASAVDCRQSAALSPQAELELLENLAGFLFEFWLELSED